MHSIPIVPDYIEYALVGFIRVTMYISNFLSISNLNTVRSKISQMSRKP